MMTTELSFIQRNAVESARLAAAMAEFETRGGQVRQVGVFKPQPAPPRKDWVDPDTVLKRRGVQLTRAERFRVRAMAEAI
jgi:hypothetical protein